MSHKNYSRAQVSQIARVAQLYHHSKMTQPQIAQRLSLSQAGVSRALKEAERLGIVQTTVNIPEGFFSEIELELEERYKLSDVVVVEAPSSNEEDLMAALGDAAAFSLEKNLPNYQRVGVFPWSETLLYAVKAMRPLPKSQTENIIQVFGGLGLSSGQVAGLQLTSQLAQKTQSEAVYLMVPGICHDEETREAILNDESCQLVFDFFNRLDMIVLGIGTISPSRYLRESGNSMTQQEQDELIRLGAVGDIGQNFVNDKGKLVECQFSSRIIGIGFEQLMKTPYRLAVAGGFRKREAIRGVLMGGCLTSLITDLDTARYLLDMVTDPPCVLPAKK